jgi:hypothetical protein
MRIADVLKPYMRINPLYAVLCKSLVRFRHNIQFPQRRLRKKEGCQLIIKVLPCHAVRSGI